MIELGQAFPNFSLPNQDGKTVTLDDFKGKWLVVYVYPKDDTPGCAIQGKSFTASRSDFQAAGIEVVGVSGDDVASHKNFCNKFGFTIEPAGRHRRRTAQRHERGPARVQGNDVLEPDQLRRRPRGNPAEGVHERHPRRPRTGTAHRHQGASGLVSRSGPGTCPPVRRPAIGMCWSGGSGADRIVGAIRSGVHRGDADYAAMT